MTESRKLLIFLFVTFPIASAFDSYFKLSRRLEDVSYLPHLFIIGVCCFIWCKMHANENNMRITKYHALFCGLFPIFGISYYAYFKYGFKKGTILIGKAVLFFIVAISFSSTVSLVFQHVYD
jgi:hypothetical protein